MSDSITRQEDAMENKEENFSITAFLVGGLLGASASMLFSPKSGQETRAGIKQQADDYIKDVKSRTDELIKDSKSAGELLKRKAEDLIDTVKQYAMRKINKPVSVVEKEIESLKAAINAAKASYTVSPAGDNKSIEKDNGQSLLKEFDDETLPKHIGMGKGRNRNSYYS